MDATLTAPRVRARLLLTLLAGAVAALIAAGAGWPGTGGLDRPAPAPAQVSPAYGALPLSFQPNRGQTDRRVRFLSSGLGYGLFLTRHRAVLALRPPGRGATGRKAASRRPSVLSMSLIGARPNPTIVGAGPLPGRVNYLNGDDRSRWQAGIPTFSAVRYSAVWPGIGMSFYGNQRRLEYDFDLAPGAGAGAIRLRFAGQRNIRIDGGGGLRLDFGGRTVRQLRPRAYQVLGDGRHPVASRYVLLGNGRVGIRVGAHDPRRALVIDPQLVYSTYLGGGEKYGDIGRAIAVDPAGNAYITGSSYYSNFPTTPGAFQTDRHGDGGPFSTTAFVTALNPAGSGLVYSTYLSGKGNETTGTGIAVDQAGDAYVTGTTSSNDFPTTPGAFQARGSGAFVAKLNPAGSGLLYSTFLSAHPASSTGIAVDQAGDAYVTGAASPGFPTTAGAFAATGSGAFVAKLNPAGSGLLYSTLLGDDKSGAGGIAVDPGGNAYIAGATDSKAFPTTPGAFQARGSGAFVAKLNPAGSGLRYSTLLGDGESYALAIAIDQAGNAYVAGETRSRKLPTTTGAFQVAVQGKKQTNPTAFVTKVDPGGSRLIYSTYLGGPSGSGPCGCGGATGIAVDPAGNAYVIGTTASKRFPTTTGALQRAKRPEAGYDGSPFVSELNAAGSGLAYSTYLGGSGPDIGSALALDPAGHIFVTGGVVSYNFPSTSGAFQPQSQTNFGYAAFVTELDPAGPPLAGLSRRTVELRGDRVRLEGALDSGADGILEGDARRRQLSRRVRLRRHHGQFIAMTPSLQEGNWWRITIRFQGRQPWDSESLCRRVYIGANGPRGWTRLPSKRC